MENEIWKDIPGYEGIYQVSDFGRLKSLDRTVFSKTGMPRTIKGRELKPRLDKDGYITFILSKNSKPETVKAHTLVCICFLNYSKRPFFSIDHINGVKSDNRLVNLQIISHRENVSKSMKDGKSKYRGVDFNIQNNKWRARIMVNGKRINLGYFETESEANEKYQNRLQSQN